ncbi:hypothetical protein BJX76DRAFT_330019 [Aspergillus varians]
MGAFVAGVGTVELRVRSSNRGGYPIRTLVLENVLHIPSATCNGFCWPKYHSAHGGSVSFDQELLGTDGQDHLLWYGQFFCGLRKLVLAGNPQGESYLENGKSYFFSMYIDENDLKEILS